MRPRAVMRLPRLTIATLVSLVAACGDSPSGPNLVTDPRVTITAPAANGIVAGDTVLVEATITVASSALSSVTATMDSGSSVAMSYVTASQWRGVLDIATVGYGTHVVTVVARYAAGDTAVSQVAVRVDRPPIVTVTAPLPGTVGRPTITVTATCQDDGPNGCQQLRAQAATLTYTVAGGSLQATMDLAGFDGGAVMVTVTGTDAGGQTTAVGPIQVWAEVSTNLTHVATVRGTVLDYSGSRVLHVDRSGDSAAIRLADVAAQTDQSLFQVGRDEILTGGVGPALAILRVNYGTGGNPKIVTWEQGLVTVLGMAGNRLQVAGDYALFAVANLSGLQRLDLATGSYVTVDMPSVMLLDASGAITGQRSSFGVQPQTYSIIVFHAGAYDTVATTAAIGLTLPYRSPARSDGERVIFDRYGAIETRGVTTDTQAVVLATGLTLAPSYDIHAGWLAYQKPDGGGVLQAWTRSPAGVESQRTALAASSSVVGVGADGSVVILQPDAYYYVSVGNSTPRRLGGAGINTIKWVDGRFVVFIGRSVFEVLP